jgi:hypothetical protein
MVAALGRQTLYQLSYTRVEPGTSRVYHTRNRPSRAFCRRDLSRARCGWSSQAGVFVL